MTAGQPIQLPHDIRGLVVTATPWWMYVLAVLAVVLVILLLVCGVWLYRRWRQRRTPGKAAALNPWQRLHERAAAMRPSGDFPVGRVQEDYFYGLSLLLREAIELRTQIPATDLTYQELQDPVRKKLPLAPDDSQSVLKFLERSDMVKFAGAPSTLDEAVASQQQLVGWVQKLTPKSDDRRPTDLARGRL